MTKRHDWTKPFDTTIEIDGVEMDAAVFYHYQPAEPDVNVGAAEIESVIFEDQGDVSDQMTDRQLRNWLSISLPARLKIATITATGATSREKTTD